MHRRNTKGLQAHADQKRADALEKAEAGIRALLKARRAINFESVAEAAGVSRTWLYRQPELRARIEHLRSQQAAKPSPAAQKASVQSNSAVVRTVKAQNQKLQAQVQELRQHLEVVHGRNLALQEEVDRLQRQIVALQANQDVHQGQRPVSPSLQEAVPVEGAESIDAALQELGIDLNPTLRKTIAASAPDAVLSAIAALKEAISAGAVERPGGWLKRAIEQGWQPG
jgi:chromosome segregation ATPase